ncbi:MAG: hypothetical protein JWN78_1614 [Bacteroidota bacterium]|nr:hypothetical protein [Bacteroidota bacterium]
MKQEIIKQPVSSNGKDDTAQKLQSELIKAHEVFTKTEVPPLAAGYGRRIPALPKENDKLDPYVMKLIMFYMEWVSKINLALHGSMQIVYGKFQIAELTEKIFQKKREKELLEQDKGNLEDDKIKMGIVNPPKSHSKYRLLISVMIFADVISVIAACLNVFEDAVIIAVILGIFIGISLFMLIKSAVTDLRDQPQSRGKIIVKWGIIVLLFVMAIVLGSMRAKQSEQETKEDHTIAFVLINILVFASTAYAIYRYIPSDEVQQKMEAYENIENGINKKQIAITQIQREIDLLVASKNLIGTDKLRKRHDQRQLNLLIKSLYKQAVAVFVELNIRTRTDGIFPDCFHEIKDLDISNEDEIIVEPQNNEQ